MRSRFSKHMSQRNKCKDLDKENGSDKVRPPKVCGPSTSSWNATRLCLGHLGHGWSERSNRQFESSYAREHTPSKEGDPDRGFGVAQVGTTATETRRELTTASSWPLERIEDPGHNRSPIVHKFLDLKPNLVGHDDEICINTQTSSQWDGLRKCTYYGCPLLRPHF